MKERLQKILSARGVASRRKAEEWILAGRVQVDGRVAGLGDQADPALQTIAVDGRLRTSQPHIRALGDVKGGLQFTYISLDDFRIVRDALWGEGKRDTGNRGPVAYAVFMDPPLARVGLSEEEARAQGLTVTIAKLPAAAIPRARLLGETSGLLKAVADADSGAILGCALHCADAGEMINTVTAAMRAGQNSAFLRDMIYTHPSMTEALNDLFGQIS